MSCQWGRNGLPASVGSGVRRRSHTRRMKDYATFKAELFGKDPAFAYAGEDAFQVAYQAYLNGHSKTQSNGNTHHSTRDSRRTTREERTEDSASFDCITCRTGLRIRLRCDATSYRCPTCGTEYRTVVTGSSAPVFLVVPKVGSRSQHASDLPRRPRREVTPQVRAALATFGLDESATIEQIRTRFRELVKSYHPDKVASLGVELRRVAEQKTKEINGAYRVLQDFQAA